MSISTTPPEYKEGPGPQGTGHKKDGPPKGPVP
jgi:hypothetical protein